MEKVWSPCKRGIVGSYHQVGAKHFPAYLDEMEFRFNNLARDPARDAVLGPDLYAGPALGRKEGVLCALGFTEAGERVLLSSRPGCARQSRAG